MNTVPDSGGLISASTALKDIPKEPSALIDGILPLGVITLLAADPKAGKTTFAWHLVESVLTGTPFAGREVHSPGPVLWIGSDSGWKHELRNREAEKYPNLFFPDEETLRGLKSYGSNREAWRTAMERMLAAVKASGVRLVVIDHLLGFAIGEDGADKPEFIKPWLEAVAAMAEETDISVLVLIHNSKGGYVPHSYAILAIVRHILRLKRGKERRITVVTKGNLYADSVLGFPYMSPSEYRFEEKAVEPAPTQVESSDPKGSKGGRTKEKGKAERVAAQLEQIRADLADAPAGLSVLAQAEWLRSDRGYEESTATLRRRISSL